MFACFAVFLSKVKPVLSYTLTTVYTKVVHCLLALHVYMLAGQINLIFQKPTPGVRPSAISLKYYTVHFVALEILNFITDQIASKSLLSPQPLLSSFPHRHCCY